MHQFNFNGHFLAREKEDLNPKVLFADPVDNVPNVPNEDIKTSKPYVIGKHSVTYTLRFHQALGKFYLTVPFPNPRGIDLPPVYQHYKIGMQQVSVDVDYYNQFEFLYGQHNAESRKNPLYQAQNPES